MFYICFFLLLDFGSWHFANASSIHSVVEDLGTHGVDILVSFVLLVLVVQTYPTSRDRGYSGFTDAVSRGMLKHAHFGAKLVLEVILSTHNLLLVLDRRHMRLVLRVQHVMPRRFGYGLLMEVVGADFWVSGPVDTGHIILHLLDRVDPLHALLHL